MEDINQHFEQLRRLLVKLGYPHSIDKERIRNGVTTELLPLLHFGLLSHSKVLATFILSSGYDLYKKNDLRFTEGIYKLLRTEFKYNPILHCSQFLTDKGFAKRKIQFVVKILKLAISKHNELIKQKKLENASKISWNKTKLSKKIDKVIKNDINENKNKKKQKEQQNNKKKFKKINKNKKLLSLPPPPKRIPSLSSTSTISSDDSNHKNIIQQTSNNDNDDDNDNNVLMNNSLTVDEIRNDLPQPISHSNSQQSLQMQAQKQQQQQQQQHLPKIVIINANDINKNEINSEEIEEKTIEITDEQLYGNTPQIPINLIKQTQKQDDNDNNDNDDVNQSIQIPSTLPYSFDMNLIPQYDPNKFVDGTADKIIHQTDGDDDDDDDDHDDDDAIYEDDNDDDDDDDDDNDNDNANDLNIAANNQHYSSSYLNTYSTLIDIQDLTNIQQQPQPQPQPQIHNDNDNNNSNNPDKQLSTIQEDNIVSNSSKQAQQPQIISNLMQQNDNDDKKQYEDMDISDNNNNNNGQNDDDDDNNNNNDNNDNDNDDGKQDDNQDKNDKKDDKDTDDDDQQDTDDKDNNNSNSDINNAISMIMNRLDKMENKMSSQFQSIGARLTILEGKMKFVEGKLNNKQNIIQQIPPPPAPVPVPVPAASSNRQSQVQPPVPPPSLNSNFKEHKYDINNDTFVESTIGSSSLPVSLTPAPYQSHNNNNNNNNNNHMYSKTVSRPNMHIPSVPIISNINNKYQPKHIHVSTTKSPFIGSTIATSLQPFNNSYNNNRYTPQTMFNGTLPNEIMRYPMSSSSSDDKKQNNASSIPRIEVHSIQASSNPSDSGPDSTLNFINDLKQMLKNTDELLKQKPMGLYQAHI